MIKHVVGRTQFACTGAALPGSDGLFVPLLADHQTLRETEWLHRLLFLNAQSYIHQFQLSCTC